MSKMLNAKFLSVGLILLFTLLFHEVECVCRLNINLGNEPLLTQKFGSKEIIIQATNFIDLDESDEVQAYCATGFKDFNTYNSNYGSRKSYNAENTRTLKFYCKSAQIIFSDEYPSFKPTRVPIAVSDTRLETSTMPQCRGTMYAMFESANKLPNCEDASTYVVGADLNMPIIIAGLCYDLNGLKLKYVSYKLHESSSLLETHKQFYPKGLDENSLTYPLKTSEHLFYFPSDIDVKTDLELQAKTNFWLQIANYELDNLIQTSRTVLKSTLDEFKNFFNIIWWRNLRIGNWRRFMQLLESRSKHVKYNIYSGTSGKLQIPVEKRTCENITSVELELSVSAVIPQFVWTYLQSTSLEAVEDFVVIAYNSPYFEYFDQNSTVICQDMCDEIAWLQPIQDSRRVAALGKIYCCRSEDAVGLLDDFPLKTSNQTNSITEATVEK